MTTQKKIALLKKASKAFDAACTAAMVAGTVTSMALLLAGMAGL